MERKMIRSLELDTRLFVNGTSYTLNQFALNVQSVDKDNNRANITTDVFDFDSLRKLFLKYNMTVLGDISSGGAIKGFRANGDVSVVDSNIVIAFYLDGVSNKFNTITLSIVNNKITFNWVGSSVDPSSITVVKEEGTSDTSVMSQNGVTLALKKRDTEILATKDIANTAVTTVNSVAQGIDAKIATKADKSYVDIIEQNTKLNFKNPIINKSGSFASVSNYTLNVTNVVQGNIDINGLLVNSPKRCRIEVTPFVEIESSITIDISSEFDFAYIQYNDDGTMFSNSGWITTPSTIKANKSNVLFAFRRKSEDIIKPSDLSSLTITMSKAYAGNPVPPVRIADINIYPAAITPCVYTGKPTFDPDTKILNLGKDFILYSMTNVYYGDKLGSNVSTDKIIDLSISFSQSSAVKIYFNPESKVFYSNIYSYIAPIGHIYICSIRKTYYSSYESDISCGLEVLNSGSNYIYTNIAINNPSLYYTYNYYVKSNTSTGDFSEITDRNYEIDLINNSDDYKVALHISYYDYTSNSVKITDTLWKSKGKFKFTGTIDRRLVSITQLITTIDQTGMTLEQVKNVDFKVYIKSPSISILEREYKLKNSISSTSSGKNISSRLSCEFMAHRGIHVYMGVPENCLAGYRLAGMFGFKYVETDVSATQDGVLVLMHDTTINRTCCNIDGTEIASPINISDITYDDLYNNYRLKSNNIAYQDKVPTYKEYLIVCRDNNLYPVSEIKSSGMTTELITQMYNESCEILGDGNFGFCSFRESYLDHVRTLSEKPQLWYIVLANKTPEYMLSKGNMVWYPASSELTPDIVTPLKKEGIKIGAWTINSSMQTYIDKGCQYISTDRICSNLNIFDGSINISPFEWTKLFTIVNGTNITDYSVDISNGSIKYVISAGKLYAFYCTFEFTGSINYNIFGAESYTSTNWKQHSLQFMRESELNFIISGTFKIRNLALKVVEF